MRLTIEKYIRLSSFNYLNYLKSKCLFSLSDVSLEPLRHKIDGEIALKLAESSVILRYFDPELGIDGNMDTSAKFVSDNDSFWYKVYFHDIRCVDQVMSLDADIYTHTWTCDESGCGTPCKGVMCKFADITVLNSRILTVPLLRFLT